MVNSNRPGTLQNIDKNTGLPLRLHLSQGALKPCYRIDMSDLLEMIQLAQKRISQVTVLVISVADNLVTLKIQHPSTTHNASSPQSHLVAPPMSSPSCPK